MKPEPLSISLSRLPTARRKDSSESLSLPTGDLASANSQTRFFADSNKLSPPNNLDTLNEINEPVFLKQQNRTQSERIISKTCTNISPEERNSTKGKKNGDNSESEEENDDIIIGENSPIRLVRYTVSAEDNRSTPTLTLRVLIIGFFLTIVLSAINQYFYFRTFPLVISNILVLFITYPLGKVLEWILPTSKFKIGSFKFYINPGPFSLKEHVMIINFTLQATSWPYGMLFVTATRLHWNIDLGYTGSFLFVMFGQLIGIAIAGSLIKLLILPANMFWPNTLVSISLLRTLHGGQAHNIKLKFFILITSLSFILYFVPGYLFQSLSMLPVLCLISPTSKTLNMMGSPINGLGMGVISFDWAAITSNLQSPLVIPFYIATNMIIGFVLIMYIIVPIGYITNLWNTQLYPIAGFQFYDSLGNFYDLRKVVDPITRTLNLEAYRSYSPLKITFAMGTIYGAGFAGLGAMLSYILLYHGKNLLKLLKNEELTKPDIHSKLMKKYPSIPNSWFLTLFVISLIMGLVFVELYPQVQLPWYGVILAIAIGAFFTLPNGILFAISSQLISINVISELLGGLIFPGKAISNMLFKSISSILVYQVLSTLNCLKLGHYTKIPPRHTFIVIILGTVLSVSTSVIVSTHLMKHVESLCGSDLSRGWTCENSHTFSNASVIWGLIGARRLFSSTQYTSILYFFPLGFILPFFTFFLSRRYPHSTTLQYINIPIIFGSVLMLPPAFPFQYPLWYLLAFIFNYVIYRKRFDWWSKYNYIFSAAMDGGIAIAGLILFGLMSQGIVIKWWGNSDVSKMCPLA